MKTKTSISNLINLNTCITGITKSSEKMSGLVIFRLTKTVSIITPHIEAFDAARKQIIENYTIKNKEGEAIIEGEEGAEVYKLEEGGEEKVNKELQDVLKEEVEVELAKIPLTTFEGLTINMNEIVGISIFIDLLVDEDI